MRVGGCRWTPGLLVLVSKSAQVWAESALLIGAESSQEMGSKLLFHVFNQILAKHLSSGRKTASTSTFSRP